MSAISDNARSNTLDSSCVRTALTSDALLRAFGSRRCRGAPPKPVFFSAII